jgi:hypothetical protein
VSDLIVKNIGRKVIASAISDFGGANSNLSRYARESEKKQIVRSIKKINHLGVFLFG